MKGIMVLIDIHGATNCHPFSVCIATGSERNNLNGRDEFCSLLKKSLSSGTSGMIVAENVDFTADSAGVISHDISERSKGTACFELEISSDYRDFENEPKMREICSSLSDCIQEINLFIDEEVRRDSLDGGRWHDEQPLP